MPFVLNVGPDRSGRIPDDQIAVLLELKGLIGGATQAAPTPSATPNVTPAVTPALAPVAENGLVLYLNFDEPPVQGIVRDMSGRSNHGRVEGATWVPDGRFGGAMRFDIRQRTQRVRVPNSDSLNPQRITIAAWIKSADADEFWNRIADKDYRRGYDLCLGGRKPNTKDWSGQVGVEINGHFAFSDERVADGQWHHVAGTYDGQVQLLYVDGRLQKPRTRWTGTISANNYDLCIGNTLVDYNPPEFLAFDGLIDEFRIYDRALSGEEIAGLMNIPGHPPAAAAFDPASLRYGLYLHFDITTFTGYQDMSRVGKAPPSLFAPRALDVRQWARVAREAGATFAVLTAKHEAGFCMWPAKDSDYHVGLSPARTDIVGEFVTACKAEGLKAGVHYSVPDARIEGQVKFRGPVEAAHFEIIKKHLVELTSRYPDIVVYALDCAQRLSPEQFSEVSNLLKQSNPQRLVLQTALNERRGRIPSIPGVPEHNAVSVNRNWFWAPNAPLTPASKLFEEWQNSSRQNFPLLVNVGPDRDGRIPADYVAVLTELKGLMGGATQAAPASAQNRRLQWFGYCLRDKAAALPEIAAYTNFVLLRKWDQNDHRDQLMETARKAGLKVVLSVPHKQNWNDIRNVAAPLITKYRDIVAAICWYDLYYDGGTPEQLAEDARRVRQAFPQLQRWAEFVEKPRGRANTKPIPPEIDVVIVNNYFAARPGDIRNKANDVLAGWVDKAQGRPVLFQWLNYNFGKGPGLVPSASPATMRMCATIAQEFGLAGLVFHSYDDDPDATSNRLGIETNPALVNELKAIAKEFGISK
jgi:alpha-L-fucosidase